MNKTCVEAYNIYEQYNTIHKNPYDEKVKYVKKVLDTYRGKEEKEDFTSMASLRTLVIYIEKTIGSCALNDFQKGGINECYCRIIFEMLRVY